MNSLLREPGCLSGLLGWIHGPAAPKELQEIVRQADQNPFVLTVVKASEIELAEVTNFFDLAKHGLNYLFA